MSKRSYKVIDAEGVPTDPEERARWLEAAIQAEVGDAKPLRPNPNPNPDHAATDWNPQRRPVLPKQRLN